MRETQIEIETMPLVMLCRNENETMKHEGTQFKASQFWRRTS